MEDEEMGIEKGYKIVYCGVNQYLSMYTDDTIKTVQYKINEKVYPNKRCGPLCVFLTIDHAESFLAWNCTIEKLHSIKIFECEFERSLEEHVWFFIDMDRIVRDRPTFRTVLANWVKLTKCILNNSSGTSINKEHLI